MEEVAWMVEPSSKREKLVNFGRRGCYRHAPEVDQRKNETPVLPSRPLTPVLVRPLRLFREYPRLVLRKWRAKWKYLP